MLTLGEPPHPANTLFSRCPGWVLIDWDTTLIAVRAATWRGWRSGDGSVGDAYEALTGRACVRRRSIATGCGGISADLLLRLVAPPGPRRRRRHPGAAQPRALPRRSRSGSGWRHPARSVVGVGLGRSNGAGPWAIPASWRTAPSATSKCHSSPYFTSQAPARSPGELRRRSPAPAVPSTTTSSRTTHWSPSSRRRSNWRPGSSPSAHRAPCRSGPPRPSTGRSPA